MNDAADAGGRYALGHADAELDRLDTQARIIDPVTRRFWQGAGVGPGMRVLDVGCGAGHTALLLADLVGETGQVVGVDTAGEAIAAARLRCEGHANLSFVQGDPRGLAFEVPFDAAVGRYVLMFQGDAPAFVAAAARHVRPGGIVAFHELDAGGIASRPPVPTFDQVASWNAQVTRRYGADPTIGSSLYAVSLTAGLPEPALLTGAVHGRGADAVDVLTQTRNLARSLLPELERHGIATPEQVGIDTLLDRMLAEATLTDSILVGHLQVGAHSTLAATDQHLTPITTPPPRHRRVPARRRTRPDT